MSIESVMPCNPFILYCPLLLPSTFPSIGIFPNELTLHIRWPKYWNFNISPSNEYSWLVSCRIDWFWSCSPRGSQECPPAPHFKHINSSVLTLFMVQLSHPYMTTGKTIALTIQTFVSKVISLLFNTLSRFVIAILPRSKHLLISWLQSISAVILEPKKIKSFTVFPCFCHEVMGPATMVLVFFFLMLSFKPAFLCSSFTFIKKLLCFLLLEWYYLHIWGYWYFSQQSWFQLVIHPALRMMYSIYKLNKQGDNIQAWCTPFPIWNQSDIPCPILIVASWTAYSSLRRQVKWSGIPISLRIFCSQRL